MGGRDKGRVADDVMAGKWGIWFSCTTYLVSRALGLVMGDERGSSARKDPGVLCVQGCKGPPGTCRSRSSGRNKGAQQRCWVTGCQHWKPCSAPHVIPVSPGMYFLIVMACWSFQSNLQKYKGKATL